jgi:hypothetical protein
MVTNPVPLDFKWVQARAKCSALCVFKELHAGVTGDVAPERRIVPPYRLNGKLLAL